MFTKILEWLRGVLDNMLDKSKVKETLGVEVAISNEMLTALDLWSTLYKGEANWLVEGVKSLDLPATIASEIARATTIEMAVDIGGDTPRSVFLAEQFAKVMPQLRESTEYAAAKGGLIFKPYPTDTGISVDYLQADQFYPVAFDNDGNIIGCIFTDQIQTGKDWFTRLEYHSMENVNIAAEDQDEVLAKGYTIRNAAFKSSSKESLGHVVPLDSVPAWADLEEEAFIFNSNGKAIERPLFAYLKYPSANNIDPTSPLGVSCYSRAVNLIQQADELWCDISWEFSSGKRALYVDEQAFKKDDDNKPVLPRDRLIRTLKAAGIIGDTSFFEEWSPEFREEQYLRGFNAIQKRIEFNVGLAYGTLSDPDMVDKTATEIQSSKQRSAATVVDYQKSLDAAIEHLLYAMDTWTTLNGLAPIGTYELATEYDDSLVVDADSQFSHDSQTVGMAAMPKTVFLMRNYGLNEETANTWLKDAQAEQPDDDPFGENT